MFPSGNSKNSKDQFIKAQKEAKAQREKDKQRQKSATQIQACFRGSRARQNILKELILDPSKKISDVCKLKDKLSSHQFPLLANKFLQYKGLLSFVIFIKPSNAKFHSNLILGLSELVLSSLEADDSIFLNIINHDKDTSLLWYIRMKHILLGLLEIAYVKKKTMEEESYSQTQEIAEKLLEKVLNIKPSLWKNLEVALTKNPNLDITLRKSIKEKITRNISSSVVQNMIHSGQFKDSSFLRKFVLKISAERDDIENGEMFVRLLGLQAFYEDFGKINLIKRQRLVQSMNEQIASQVLIKRNVNYKFEIVLSLIKDNEFLSRFFTEIVEFFSYLVSNNLLQGFEAPFFARLFDIFISHLELYGNALLNASENKKIISHDMEVEEEKTQQQQQSKEYTPQQKREFLKEILEKKSNMSILSNPEGIRHFCQIISSIISQLTSADFDIFSNLVAKGCSVFLLFKRVLNTNDRMLYKNILSFELSFFKTPFICIKRQGYNVKSMLFVPEKYIPIIKVFSDCLYQTLRITDDEEFLNNNEITVSTFPLSKEDLIETANFSNYLLYNVLWNRVSAFYSVITSQVKLVRELKARDTRLKYCPKDFWIIPELVKISEQMLSDPDQLKVEAHSDILEKAPHMLTFETRLKILDKLIETDKGKYDRFPAFDPEYDIDDDDGIQEGEKDPKIVSIHRQFLLEDGFDKILRRRDMRSIFMIRFINEHGMAEEGIDGGGLLKEFITLISKIAFDVNYGLFHENEDRTLMPSPTSFSNPDHLKLFNFIGRLTGKAIYEHILLENVFSVIFLNRILKIPNTMNELKFADPTLYKNLMLLKHRNDVADKLNLTFSVDEIRFGEAVTVPLKPNGDKIEVNESNKLEYISLFCNYKLNLQIDAQSKAFLNGLKSCIDLSWIKLFDQQELQFLISGERRKGFNVFDLQANVEVRGFTRDDVTIVYLWEVLNEMNDDERSLFLHFITGCSRPPTLGFKSMTPKIAIHNASQGKVGNAHLEDLPTSSTCANLFKLPDYRNKQLLKTKILYAISSNAGFDLG